MDKLTRSRSATSSARRSASIISFKPRAKLFSWARSSSVIPSSVSSSALVSARAAAAASVPPLSSSRTSSSFFLDDVEEEEEEEEGRARFDEREGLGLDLAPVREEEGSRTPENACGVGVDGR